MDFKLGSLVTYRRRSWILADREGSVLYLRPLGGGDGESLPVHLDLLVALKDTLPHESLSPASFPPPPPSSPLPPRLSAGAFPLSPLIRPLHKR